MYAHYSALQIRLNTQPLVTEMEKFLKGSVLEYIQNPETGEITTHQVKIGEPLANDKGCQRIMSILTSLINPQTVQGNLNEIQFNQIVYDIKMDLSYELVLNYHEWGIKEEDRSYIVRTLEKMAFMFISRTLNNKERDGYGESMRTLETVIPKRGALALLGGNKQNG